MKAKGAIVSVLVTAALVVGTAYGIGTSMKRKEEPVEVVALPSINEASSGMMDSSTLSGNIVSKDTQIVSLDTNHTVKKVYVSEGDMVKKGDTLMTYDMEMDKLKREAQDLTRQGLELQLTTMQRDLATMESGRFPANYGSDNDLYASLTGSSSWADEDDNDDDRSSADLDYEDNDDTMSADGSGEAQGESTDGPAENPAPLEEAGEDDQVITDQDQTGLTAPEEDGNQVLLDPGAEGDSDLSAGDSTIVESGLEEDGQEDPELLNAVNNFLSDVNRLTDLANGGYDQLLSDQAGPIFQEAFDLFRTQLSSSGGTTVTDLFGESRSVSSYLVSGQVSAMVGEATASVLQQAYDRLCVYQLLAAVRGIFPGQTQSSAAYDYDAVSAVAELIHKAADAFYQLQRPVYQVNEAGEIVFSTEFSALNEPAFGDQNLGQYLLGLIGTLNSSASTILPGASNMTELPMTEMPFPDDPGGGGGDPNGDLKAAIEQQKKDIVECKLQIREAALAIKDYDRTLAGETVTARLSGLVKQAGTTTEQPASGGFIVVTGKAGLYVEGALSERSLDSLKVGDIITGTSWESGMTFTAQITEISPYPADSGSNSFFVYDPTNDRNSSLYPFLAYIEDAEGLSADYGVELNVSKSQGDSKLMLPPYMIRTDSSGRPFCYVRGEDDRLQKRYVKTKDTGFGLISVLSGLRVSDFIAFPYGDDVKEGAPTREVEGLKAVNGEDDGMMPVG